VSDLKAIIFDYDGIIAESVQVKTKAFAQIYSSFGKEVVNKVINHHEANGGVSRFEKFKIYHKSFLDKDLSQHQLNQLTEKFSNLVLEKVIASRYVEGVFDFINLNYKDFKFFISTGTPKNEIDIILKRKKLNKYFVEAFGSPEKKDVHVRKILKKYNLSQNEVIFIGDALSDRNAAKNNNINFIGRYTTEEEIKNEKYLIKDFNNFNIYIKKFQSC
jgi:phosphoglycolate phosphatase-like HAD superfamily hydrolase